MRSVLSSQSPNKTWSSGKLSRSANATEDGRRSFEKGVLSNGEKRPVLDRNWYCERDQSTHLESGVWLQIQTRQATLLLSGLRAFGNHEPRGFPRCCVFQAPSRYP